MNNKLMELPKCPNCGTPMTYRPAGAKEQAYCGTWYDCHEPNCKCSTLLPSAELRELYGLPEPTPPV